MTHRPALAVAAFVVMFAAITVSAQSKPVTTPATVPAAFTAEQVVDVMRRAADYQIAEQAKGKPSVGWVRAAFYTGVMALHETTKDEKYLDAAIKWSEQGNWSPPPREKTWRHADDVAAGQTYLEIFFLKKDPKMIAPVRERYDRLMNEPLRGREDWWWCDALYMSPPTLARLAKATGDNKYLLYMDEQFWDATDFLFDKDEKLYYRDKKFFPPAATKNGKKIFWSRGNSWVMGGLVRVLQYLPKDHPSRPKYVEMLRTLTKSVAAVQREDGMWSPSLLDREEFDAPESSGTAFFTYAIAWGINNGILDRAYEPGVRKAWSALVEKVSPEGRLGYVQRVAAAPGGIKPTDTHEYAVGALLLAGSEMIKFAKGGGSTDVTERRIDFGNGPAEVGYKRVPADVRYDAAKGYGWLDAENLVDRDRKAPDALRGDYAFGRAPATFRVDVKPGLYKMTLIFGDMTHGDHVLDTTVDAPGVKLPTLTADAAEFATLTAAFEIPSGQLNLRCDSPEDNWVLNALTLEPAEKPENPKVTKQQFAESTVAGPRPAARDTWPDVKSMPDPIAVHVKRFRDTIATREADLAATGLKRADYLKLIAGNVDFFKQHQDEHGAIIDPYRKVEFQYATPCFAYAAATLVAHAKRDDLLEPAARAFDWASSQLSKGEGATNHDDFYPPSLARAYPLLKDRVAKQRAKKWADDLSGYDPYKVYSYAPGANNWNVVSSSGEFLLHKLALRKDLAYVEDSVRAQGRHFDSVWGMYTEGPMAYDHFPRLWAGDLIGSGYTGVRSSELSEMLRRGALTSLFMQSPTGELPTGGRSAHHQWNEAEQCVTYEIYAAKSLVDGDKLMAGVFKRAARIALSSMFRWQRPGGEMWIVKNRADPKDQHGYESYSSHSQYNLLPMAMLAIAHDYAAKTEDVAEQVTPAEIGGFVVHIGDVFNKVFANAGGMYVELDVAADPSHNATGLLRVHKKGFNPQIGPSEGLIGTKTEQYPADAPRTTAAIGAAWKDVNGNWKRLAEYQGRDLSKTSVVEVAADPNRASFTVIYQGYFSGPHLVTEHYVVTSEQVEQTIDLPGYAGPVRITFPVLADLGDGKATQIATRDQTVRVTLAGQTQTFTAPGASSVTVEEVRYPFRNGWARLGVAEFPAGTAAKLIIRPEAGSPAR